MTNLSDVVDGHYNEEVEGELMRALEDQIEQADE